MRLRGIALLLAIALLLPAAARAADWSDHSVRCADGRPGCRLLQMVMMGSFGHLDVEDALTVRVFSAAYSQLCAVSEEDVAHFLGEFGEEEAVVRGAYNAALANCLRADILAQKRRYGRVSDAQRVLMLFLDPDGEEDAAAQMAEIRARMTEALLERLAEAVEAPPAFIRWLIGPDDPAGEAASK